MPDPDSSPPVEPAKRTKEYPIGTPPATPSLGRALATRIADRGPLSFPDFMAAALYDPEAGYYARGAGRIGRSGDFFTSVSVGPLFGNLLARRFLKAFEDDGRPRKWRIIECGAHDGTLAADVLGALRDLDPAAFAALEYAILEPLPTLRAAQQQSLLPFAEITRFPENPAELAANPLPGVIFGNELLDALPCHVIERHDGRWVECSVDHQAANGFIWKTTEIVDAELIAALAGIGGEFPDGYRTEVRTCFRAFLEPLVSCLDAPLMIWPDYGFARPELYHPDRTQGTLRTFRDHRAGDDPLALPGETDITAHVDFTAVAEAARECGGVATEFNRQGAWLTGLAREWLLSLDGTPDPKALRQFQTLTHPAQLGGSFQVIELSWKPGAAPANPAQLARRLALSSAGATENSAP